MGRIYSHTVASVAQDVFPELGTTLFYFIQRLHAELIEREASQVYFLSREGQPLKEMFDAFCEHYGSNISSFYLEVSRRSTLLPSLSALDGESFETLFRQYRKISLNEFLSSLGLEASLAEISVQLELETDAVYGREEDFPSSQVFQALKDLPRFQSLYETERLKRREAFLTYLVQLSGGAMPSELVIVDVGWKGTIQDNLYAILCREERSPIRSLVGFYVGLVAEGAAGPRNTKAGLVFSAVQPQSQKFHVFNENRALFEVILAADHGSIVSYETSADGRAYPIRGEIEEVAMLEAQVLPVLRGAILQFHKHLIPLPSLPRQSVSYTSVVEGHARMVFHPTARERTWFRSIFHVENFGVFERSGFSLANRRPNIAERVRFLANLLRRRDRAALGFWPWNTVYERAGIGPAMIYAIIRKMQR